MKKIVFFVILLIVIVITLIVTRSSSKMEQQNTTSTVPSVTTIQPTQQTSALKLSENAIYVAGQGESNLVKVTMMSLSDPGFVVIHEDANGKPGAIIGSSKLIEQGAHKDISVTLTRKTRNGETIYAKLYKDNGDKSFTSEDSPIADKITGEPMYMIITVDKNYEESPDAISL